MAASFESKGRISLIKMIRIKLLFCIFFVLAYQVTYSFSAAAENVSCYLSDACENQSSIKENNLLPGIYGVVRKGGSESTVFAANTKYYLPNFKSKLMQVAILQNTLGSTSAEGSGLLKSDEDSRIIRVPVYLQTSNFRLK